MAKSKAAREREEAEEYLAQYADEVNLADLSEDSESGSDEEEDQSLSADHRRRFKLIATSREKYMEVTYGPVVFRDSFKFTQAGLAKMVECQRRNCADLRARFPYM